MIKQQKNHGNTTSRSGFTLIELFVSIGAASMLMIGLPSCIYIVTQAFNGNPAAVNRSTTAAVQTDLLNDFKHALSFSELTATAVTVIVPDRDEDYVPEVIRYSWAGTAGDPLVYQYNNETAVNLAEDVHNFNLLSLTRLVEGPVIPPPDEIDDSQNNFGYDTITDLDSDQFEKDQIATKVTLYQNATLLSISAYLATDVSEFAMALYSDNAGEPDELLASTAFVTDSGGGYNGWKTLSVPETVLTPGTYWLALSLRDEEEQRYYYESTGGESRVSSYNPFFSDAFSSTWGTNASSGTRKIYIYGTYSTSN